MVQKEAPYSFLDFQEVVFMEVTEPRPQLFSNRALVGLMIPIILDALLSIIAGMVDSAMVSSAGEAAVSAVSLVDSINILFISMFASIAVGGSVVTTQYVGSRNYQQGCVSANQLFYAGFTISTVLMLVVESTLRGIDGANFDVMTDIMYEFQAVNAANLDGGTSTSMALEGKLLNTVSNSLIAKRGRFLATCWLVSREEDTE